MKGFERLLPCHISRLKAGPAPSCPKCRVSVREGAKSGGLGAGRKLIDLSCCKAAKTKAASVQPTVLRKPEQTPAEPGRIIPLQIGMGRKADTKAFSADTCNFHAKQCSKCWEPRAAGEQLEQTVVPGKRDVAALTALFAFAVLLNSSPAGDLRVVFFFCFPSCWREQQAQHLLSAAFLHQEFLSVSPGKIFQPPTRLKTGGTEPKKLPTAALGRSLMCRGVKSGEHPQADV